MNFLPELPTYKKCTERRFSCLYITISWEIYLCPSLHKFSFGKSSDFAGPRRLWGSQLATKNLSVPSQPEESLDKGVCLHHFSCIYYLHVLYYAKIHKSQSIQTFYILQDMVFLYKIYSFFLVLDFSVRFYQQKMSQNSHRERRQRKFKHFEWQPHKT